MTELRRELGRWDLTAIGVNQVLGGASLLRARTVPEPAMRVPFGPVIPLLAVAIALAILAGATPTQLRAGGYALAAGAALFVIAGAPWRTPTP